MLLINLFTSLKQQRGIFSPLLRNFQNLSITTKVPVEFVKQFQYAPICFEKKCQPPTVGKILFKQLNVDTLYWKSSRYLYYYQVGSHFNACLPSCVSLLRRCLPIVCIIYVFNPLTEPLTLWYFMYFICYMYKQF